MNIKFGLFLFSHALVAAAGQFPHEVVQDHLDNERYSEAEKYAEEHHVEEYRGSKLIAGTKACVPILKECENIPQEIQPFRKCLVKLEKNCGQSTDKWDNKSSELTSKYYAKEEEMNSSRLKGICDDGLRWGYVKALKRSCTTCPQVLWYNHMDKMSGEYTSKDKCDEARLLDQVWEADDCHLRYIKATKKIFVYELVGMQSSENQTNRIEIKFDSMEKCEAAARNGFSYIDIAHAEHSFAQVGSSSKNRFIGKCKKVEQPICIKFKSEPELTDEVF